MATSTAVCPATGSAVGADIGAAVGAAVIFWPFPFGVLPDFAVLSLLLFDVFGDLPAVDAAVDAAVGVASVGAAVGAAAVGAAVGAAVSCDGLTVSSLLLFGVFGALLSVCNDFLFNLSKFFLIHARFLFFELLSSLNCTNNSCCFASFSV